MKTAKKFLSLLLIVIFALSCFAISASAATTYTSGDYQYTVSGSNATITKYNGSASSVTIPSTIDGYTVTTIGNSAFRNNSSLVSVSIPSTVTAITTDTTAGTGVGAFENCPNLKTVTIAAGTKDAMIGDGTFHNCTSLESIVIPGNYKSIESKAFSSCKALKSVEYKKSSSSIPNQVIGNGAFTSCSSLSKISLPTTLKTIDSSAFSNCDSLTDVIIPEGVQTIGNMAFQNCDSLTSVSIPSTVTAITTDTTSGTNLGAFENCPNLKTVTIAEGTKSAMMGDSTFHNCTSLESIVIPGNYTTIETKVFCGCKALKSVEYKKSSSSTPNQELVSSAFMNCTSLSKVSLPTTLKTIGKATFYNCDAITDIVIPEGVKTIDNQAFQGCDNLTSIVIPSTVTTITSYDSGTSLGAFDGCTKLKTVIIKEGKNDAKIGCGTFLNCNNLTTVHIPSNYVKIYNWAFKGCSNVTICNTTTECYAKTYADNNGIPFKLCSGNHEPQKFIITFNANGGSVSPSSTTVESGTYVTLPTPYKSGYTCLGWSTSSSASSASYSCGASYKPSSNVTLYAVWKQNVTTKYKITYFMNDGSVDSASQEVTAGNSIIIGSASRPGYEFLGWSTNKNASYAEYFYNEEYTPTGDTTFYAIWRKNTVTYTVTFNANGGSVSPSSSTVESGKSVTLPTPYKSGYTCLGWSTSSSASSASYSCGASYNPTYNVTLYAVWKKASEPIVINVELNYKDTTSFSVGGFTATEYKTDNSSIATVSSTGIITGISRGTTTVHAFDINGNEIKVNVTVNFAWWQWIIEILLFGWIWY